MYTFFSRLFGGGIKELKPTFKLLPEYDYGTSFIEEGRAVINSAEFEDLHSRENNQRFMLERPAHIPSQATRCNVTM